MSDIKQVIARLRIMADGFRHSYPTTAADIRALIAAYDKLEHVQVPVLWEIVGPDGVTDSMYDAKTQEMAHAVPGDTIRAYALVSTTEVKPR